MEEAKNYEFLKYLLSEDIYVLKREVQDVSLPSLEKEFVGTKTKGQNAKNIIFFNHSKGDIISSIEESFINKLLGALKLTWDDVLLINTAFVNDDEIKVLLKNSKIIISFGVTNLYTRAFTSDLHQVVNKRDVKFLLSESIIDLSNSETSKRKLWECLKQIFSI